jgi:hypothetical protein
VASGSIFRKLNLRLTALWSALFGLSAAASLALPGIAQGRMAIASAILMIPAGIFTAWYPRWYPGHLASRGSAKADPART